jgi:phosphoribosyl 1,2-cyclic phosphodiesterase
MTTIKPMSEKERFDLKVCLHGCRGSIPSPAFPSAIDHKITSSIIDFVKSKRPLSELSDFMSGLERHQKGGYGGNTSCVELTSRNGQQVIIDAGSGLRTLGKRMMADAGQGEKKDIHIFLTHFHWDHLVGLPFFIPLFLPGNRVHFYGVQSTIHSFLDVLFKKPYFPVEVKDLSAELIIHQIDPIVPVVIEDISLTPYQLDHPDPCWGYRVESHGKSYAHCVDTECLRMSKQDMGRDLPLYTNADLLLFDAQYSLEDVTAKINWGHSAAVIGLDIAEREKVKHLIFVHHDPFAPDKAIAEQHERCQKHENLMRRQAKRRDEPLFEVKWEYGHDGMEILL